MTRAYYNEIDAKAAAWLRELIKRGLIAGGEVDTRSIVDVRATDLRGFTQCHFFAGIGGWSHALRLAGWPDDRPVWTGSCPCQPFSCAGSGLAEADERHLWPFFRNLIAECRPARVVGEQVASKAALRWVDGVRADLERAGYAFGVADLCAAGVGAPHIRQRLYWVAITNDRRLAPGRGTEPTGAESEGGNCQPEQRGGSCAVAHAEHSERRPKHIDRQDVGNGPDAGRPEAHGESGACREVRGVADTQPADGRSEQQAAGARSGRDGPRRGGDAGGLADSARGRFGIDGSASGIAGHVDQCGEACGIGNADGRDSGSGKQRLQPVSGESLLDNGGRGNVSDNQQPAASSQQPAASSQQPAASSQQPAARRLARLARLVYAQQQGLEGHARNEHERNESRWIIEDQDRPTAEASCACFWSPSELIDCLDGKAWRIEPGTFPLAHGVPARVVRLRGYGNAIVPQVASEFIQACEDVLNP